MKEQRSCPACESSECDVIHRLEIRDRYFQPEDKVQKSVSYRRNYILFEKILRREVSKVDVEFRLCNNCGLIFFSPRPDERDLAFKYQQINRERDTEERRKVFGLVDLSSMRSQEIYSRVSPFLKKTSGKALDVGGADGHCLAELTKDFDCGVLDFVDCQLWPGVRRAGSTFLDLGDEQFDLILSCHTLEHIPDVRSFVRDIKRHLVDGGICYIEVPYGCVREIYRTSNILTHINFFTERSLGYLLEQAGLRISYLHSGPVLSTKKYLPVVVAISQKGEEQPSRGYCLQNGFEITKGQVSRSLHKIVALKNAALLISHPIQYISSFCAMLLRRSGLLSR